MLQDVGVSWEWKDDAKRLNPTASTDTRTVTQDVASDVCSPGARAHRAITAPRPPLLNWDRQEIGEWMDAGCRPGYGERKVIVLA